MAIISFAKTLKEYKAGIKFCTRRDWAYRQFKMWRQFWFDGKITHDAYDKSPRNGGIKIGEFELTCKPYREYLWEMPLSDLKLEGGMCNTFPEFCELIGKKPHEIVTVIRFNPLPEVKP
ncbi:hypothetical protein LCGC14_2162010 [marine sediment metagenome]|uniref:ASCH domain-containing protein n=1 Tax=marine sediment metagenome TaxID=412755 RepID=A0A0F9EEQ8_9ZZZZ